MRFLKFILIVILLTGCEEIIEVEDISNRTVTVLAPTDASTLTLTNINFSWNAVEDAEQYKLQVATPNFETATTIVEDTTLTATSFSKVLDAGDYQWRVRAENSNYETAYTTQSFTISETDAVDISDEVVVLLAPADGLVFGDTDTINFSWEALLNADNYTIQIATPDFENAVEIIEDESTTATNFPVSNLEAQSYEWRVKATNAISGTNYTTQSFTVEE
ncbi:hypothetical protein [Winogradskyella luteola]|uniref:Fibronectin type-III domain-containing protein n=1 Tax=Winogradskyella luteola TaxID=2828330 RepID=A0A9X1F842_9FLAO|nr:hypothetical protein [Winogradskyella luteola]MBV7269071.1 hypothetical protein [Winogradskyella luteola]